ncbi:hypothetical protein [Wukongibacter sp. M2B1]|uniref:hypothetical protein n=1 Tax=Wukongibacter sp. M2B1 TaxID=3088895 RepID=UPI003D7B5610
MKNLLLLLLISLVVSNIFPFIDVNLSKAKQKGTMSDMKYMKVNDLVVDKRMNVKL